MTLFVNNTLGYTILNHLQGMYYGILASLDEVSVILCQLVYIDLFHQSFVHQYLLLWMAAVMHIWKTPKLILLAFAAGLSKIMAAFLVSQKSA